MKTRGWLFDAYTLGDRMVFWIIIEQGRVVRLEDRWTHSFYVAANNKSDFGVITRNKDFARFVKAYDIISKQETIFDHSKSDVLKVTLLDSKKASNLAQTIWMLGEYGQFRLYNVDLLPVQAYFFEYDLFPLAFCEVEQSEGHLKWDLKDDVWNSDYPLPKFTSIHVEIHSRKTGGSLPMYTDRIDSIQIKHGTDIITIEHELETDIIEDFMTKVSEIDPDFIFTTKGDSFAFPYLIHRAEANKIDLYLSREKIKLTLPSYQGTTYSQYGKIFYKPAKIELLGRIHLDSDNSFVFRETGMHGFYEIARVCRMPLHVAFRASIGKCLTSLQCYHATKDDILIPWHPDVAEHPKTLEELLIADRGGLYLAPKLGVNEKVAEFDFTALFPNIMYRLNVSAETVRCKCCPDSKNMVPELGYHVCKRSGITAKSLKIVIEKRTTYKTLKQLAKSEDSKEIYDDRQTNYKWIGVTSFGYQGYSNAKNGLIDSHQVVCADARHALFKAKSIAEQYSFTIVDGIVDSLFVKKQGANNVEYLQLRDAIEKETRFEISFEGEYKWIAYLPSKRKNCLPVPNRYFGVFADGTIKVRGIEVRRHDTPPLFARCQAEILQLMARGDTIKEVKALMPDACKIFQKYVQMLRGKKALWEDLVFTKQLSKDSDQYAAHTVEVGALMELVEAGKPLRAGQVIQYVIADYYRKSPRKRSVPVELIDEKLVYDINRYTELLARVCNSVTEPFGYIVQANDY